MKQLVDKVREAVTEAGKDLQVAIEQIGKLADEVQAEQTEYELISRVLDEAGIGYGAPGETWTQLDRVLELDRARRSGLRENARLRDRPFDEWPNDPRATIERLRRERNDADTALKTSQDEVARLKGDNTKLAKLVDEGRAAVRSADAEGNRLREENTRLAGELAIREREMAARTEQSLKLQDQVRALTAQVDELKQQADDCWGPCPEHLQEIANLKAALERVPLTTREAIAMRRVWRSGARPSALANNQVPKEPMFVEVSPETWIAPTDSDAPAATFVAQPGDGHPVVTCSICGMLKEKALNWSAIWDANTPMLPKHIGDAVRAARSRGEPIECCGTCSAIVLGAGRR